MRERKQKSSVLGKLRELYVKFLEVEAHPKIGFSMFCTLHPPHCVLQVVQAHTVCTHHQDPKLMLTALDAKGITYHDLMKSEVYDNMNEECMLHRCKTCPSETGIESFVRELPPCTDPSDEVTFKQWVTVDRCSLITKMLALEDYVSSLAKNLFALARYHYFAKHQETFFKDLKTHLEAEKEGLLVLDFAENYSFLVQDAVQGFHWGNSQCTGHSFLFYFCFPDGELQHQSLCCFSDGLEHTIVMVFSVNVYVFLKVLIPALKNTCPRLEKLYYISDGCTGQFKNRFNFLNHLHHEQDFHIKAEWLFFCYFAWQECLRQN